MTAKHIIWLSSKVLEAAAVFDFDGRHKMHWKYSGNHVLIVQHKYFTFGCCQVIRVDLPYLLQILFYIPCSNPSFWRIRSKRFKYIFRMCYQESKHLISWTLNVLAYNVLHQMSYAFSKKSFKFLMTKEFEPFWTNPSEGRVREGLLSFGSKFYPSEERGRKETAKIKLRRKEKKEGWKFNPSLQKKSILSGKKR